VSRFQVLEDGDSIDTRPEKKKKKKRKKEKRERLSQDSHSGHLKGGSVAAEAIRTTQVTAETPQKGTGSAKDGRKEELSQCRKRESCLLLESHSGRDKIRRCAFFCRGWQQTFPCPFLAWPTNRHNAGTLRPFDPDPG
ncbi:hypothetical protein I7I51_04076, partial [Histoplasma capsulatum]